MDPALGLSGGVVVGGACCCSCGWCCCWAFGFLRYELEKVFWELGDVFQFVSGARCPDVCAVALDFCWGAIAEGVLEFNVHVVFNVLVGNRCFAFDLLLLRGGCEEEVMFAPHEGVF